MQQLIFLLLYSFFSLSYLAKKVGMGLTTFYILGIGAIGAVLYAELSKSFAK
jgi:hypothetical protein